MICCKTFATTITETCHISPLFKFTDAETLRLWNQDYIVEKSFHYLESSTLLQTINTMAVLTMLLTQDRCTKNFLVYRDPNTTKWQFFGYDLKSAMNTANGYGGVSANDYCTLTCAQWNSPLFCDRAHPQVYTHCLTLRSSFRQMSTVIQNLHLYVRHNFNKSSFVFALPKPVCKRIH